MLFICLDGNHKTYKIWIGLLPKWAGYAGSAFDKYGRRFQLFDLGGEYTVSDSLSMQREWNSKSRWSQFQTRDDNSPHVHSLAHQNLGFDEWPRFDVAFKRVLSSLPDELHARELLRPFEGTGPEKLRDIGLRARAFKPFFEAWEALHLVWSGDTPYISQDVVQ